MQLSVKKILSATLASVTLLLSGQALAADVEVNRVESSAEDWKNDAGEVLLLKAVAEKLQLTMQRLLMSQ